MALVGRIPSLCRHRSWPGQNRAALEDLVREVEGAGKLQYRHAVMHGNPYLRSASRPTRGSCAWHVTDGGCGLERAVGAEDDELRSLALRLRDAGCDEGVVALSPLRGQRTLDTSWRSDPSRPAIVIGTVDVIGSRLLFSAYGREGR